MSGAAGVTGQDAGRLLRLAPAFCLPFYAEAGRAYHTAAHVQAMLDALTERGVLTDTLGLAVWGHDLIYDARGTDSEARSAERFGAWLESQGAEGELVAEVRRLIVATEHRAPPTDRAAALLVDADLGVFGAPDVAFWAYERAIRAEYRFVPWPAYRAGRTRVLEGFLGRAVYVTPEFSGLEGAARTHLQAAVTVLAGARDEADAQDRWDALLPSRAPQA